MKNTETQNNTMTKQDLVKFLVTNFRDKDGYVNLSGLDFTNQDINGVVIRKMKVDGNLYQDSHEVKEMLIQNRQNVEGGLWQDYQKVEGTIFQSGQKAGSNIWQEDQIYGDSIFSTPQDGINSVLLERQV